MLTDITTDDLGITHEAGHYTERTVIVRATVTGTGREIEAAVLLDGDDKPVDDLPPSGTSGSIDFPPMAAVLLAEAAGKSSSWQALLEGELIAAAVRSRLAE